MAVATSMDVACAVRKAAELLPLKDEQKQCIEQFLMGRDVFVIP